MKGSKGRRFSRSRSWGHWVSAGPRLLTRPLTQCPQDLLRENLLPFDPFMRSDQAGRLKAMIDLRKELRHENPDVILKGGGIGKIYRC